MNAKNSHGIITKFFYQQYMQLDLRQSGKENFPSE